MAGSPQSPDIRGRPARSRYLSIPGSEKTSDAPGIPTLGPTHQCFPRNQLALDRYPSSRCNPDQLLIRQLNRTLELSSIAGGKRGGLAPCAVEQRLAGMSPMGTAVCWAVGRAIQTGDDGCRGGRFYRMGDPATAGLGRATVHHVQAAIELGGNVRKGEMGRAHQTNHVRYLALLILTRPTGVWPWGALVGSNRVMAAKYSGDLSGKAKNSRAREVARVVSINVIVLLSLLLAMEVGVRILIRITNFIPGPIPDNSKIERSGTGIGRGRTLTSAGFSMIKLPIFPQQHLKSPHTKRTSKGSVTPRTSQR
jgi:hypothetical protein